MPSTKAHPAKALMWFTKASVVLTCSWPPSPTASPLRVLLFEISWYGLLFNGLFLLLPLIKAIFECHDDQLIMSKLVCLTCAVIQVFIKMILCYSERHRFQRLFLEMENFYEGAAARERRVLQRYVNRCKRMHVVYTIWCYLTSIIMICGPLYTNQTFPTEARYPFNVHYHPIKDIVFLHQALVGLQASAGMCVDCQVALLLWYAAAKFDILAEKVRRFCDDVELRACLRKHQQLLGYVDEVKRVVKYLILTTLMTTTVAICFGALNIVGTQSLAVKTQYFVLVLIVSFELFMCAWPADYLMTVTAKISWEIYDSRWIRSDANTRRKILQCMMRSQKPTNVSIVNTLPPLSLNYYASFLNTSFSYFTALKAIINKNNAKNQ